MDYSDCKDGAVPAGELLRSMEQQRPRKSCIFNTLKLSAGAALILLLLSFTMLPVAFLQRYGCNHHEVEQKNKLADEVHTQKAQIVHTT